MNLPLSREELSSHWGSGERFELYMFYGHKPPESGVDASCLSQWFQRTFVIDGIAYPTAEHWMMAEKARLFGDEDMLAEILACDSPRDAKAFGRKVAGFDPAIWNAKKFEIVKRGNLAKFTQHEDLRAFLLSTSGSESSRSDTVAESPTAYKVSTPDASEGLGSVHEGSAECQAKDDAPVILVEAAGRDTVWGIGLGKSNPKAKSPLTWRGENVLGFVLTDVREQIRAESY